MISSFTNLPDGSICIVFESKIYSLSAIKKAAYKFSDRASLHFSTSEGELICVQLSFFENGPQIDSQQVARDFCNEVLDQDLRETISRETEPVRALILAQAFSRTSLIQ